MVEGSGRWYQGTQMQHGSLEWDIRQTWGWSMNIRAGLIICSMDHDVVVYIG